MKITTQNEMNAVAVVVAVVSRHLQIAI